MNPWSLLGVVALWSGTIAGTAAWFYEAGQDSKIAQQAEVEKARDDTRAIAAAAAASAIAQIKIENRTIQGRIERVTVEKPVYVDCRHDPSGMRDINEALTRKQPEPVSSGGLPGPDPAR
jgi:folylpolyglutamate synthase/dihydropteroate synthase